MRRNATTTWPGSNSTLRPSAEQLFQALAISILLNGLQEIVRDSDGSTWPSLGVSYNYPSNCKRSPIIRDSMLANKLPGVQGMPLAFIPTILKSTESSGSNFKRTKLSYNVEISVQVSQYVLQYNLDYRMITELQY